MNDNEDRKSLSKSVLMLSTTFMASGSAGNPVSARERASSMGVLLETMAAKDPDLATTFGFLKPKEPGK